MDNQFTSQKSLPVSVWTENVGNLISLIFLNSKIISSTYPSLAEANRGSIKFPSRTDCFLWNTVQSSVASRFSATCNGSPQQSQAQAGHFNSSCLRIETFSSCLWNWYSRLALSKIVMSITSFYKQNEEKKIIKMRSRKINKNNYTFRSFIAILFIVAINFLVEVPQYWLRWQVILMMKTLCLFHS